jgi:hypothetical protein
MPNETVARTAETNTAWLRRQCGHDSRSVEGCGYCCSADEIERLRDELKHARDRSFVAARISYRGFSYGTSSQWGIDSLRRAIEEDGRG